jgi:leucyl/phenylalanyl-tRNA--protein transferase
MKEAYIALHQQGWAHSVEVWNTKGELAGGLYGVSLGSCFFGESMFHHESNASKYGFIVLVNTLKEKGFTLIDSQVHTSHLESLGAQEIPRTSFLQLLSRALDAKTYRGKWTAWCQ